MTEDELLRTAEALERPEALALQTRIDEAEDTGDLETALRLIPDLPLADNVPWVEDLDELARAGPAATPWMWGRYICGRAHRWAIGEGDLRTNRVVRNALVTMYVEETEALIDPDTGRFERVDDLLLVGSRVVATDCLVEDAALFDAGVLADYLRRRAGPALRARAPRIGRWARTRPSVYRLESVRDTRLVVTDLRTSRRFAVLHTGEAVGHPMNGLVLGRLVPTPGRARRLFASRPVAVDDTTASELLESLRNDCDHIDRFVCIARAVEAGRMLPMPGARVQRMGLASAMNAWPDTVLPENPDLAAGSSPGPRATFLMETEGLPQLTAEGVAVCELALIITADRHHDGAVPLLAHHAAVALSSTDVFRYAEDRLTQPHHARPWRAMARCLHSVDRDRLLGLAAAAAHRATSDGVSAAADPSGRG